MKIKNKIVTIKQRSILKKKKLFAFLLLLTFLGCADDELYETSNSNAGIKSSKIKYNDFIKHTEAFNIVTDINNNQNVKNKNLKRSITDILNNFKIDTDEGVYLQYANLHSFTFSIHREVDNGKLENLVLSYQNDGTYNVKILKYDLTAQEKIDLQNDRLKTIQNPIITIPLQSFNTNLVFDSCGEYTETIYVTCSSGHHSFGNGTAFDCSFWNLSGGTPPRVYTVTKYKCIDAGGSSGGGGSSPIDSGFGPNPTPGGGGGGLVDNTYPIKYPTHETNPVDYEEGISAPVLNSENSDDIRNMRLFYQNLSPQQRQWANEDPEKYNQLIKYQIDNEWSEESEEFAKKMINNNIIEKQIDATQLNPCSSGVFQQLKNTTNNDIAQVLAKLDANGSLYNTIIKSEVAPSGEPAQTIRQSAYNYTVYISTDYTGKTKLFIAASMFHELVHAYFMSLFDDFYNANPPNLNAYNDFAGLFHYYVTLKRPSSINPADVHHQQMATDYADAIARALQEYQTGIPVSIGTSPDQIYSDLAWGGIK